MAPHGIQAVWREVGAFPAMRRPGIPEVLRFEYTSNDRPDMGVEFHVTRELATPQQASRAMADLRINERARALECGPLDQHSSGGNRGFLRPRTELETARCPRQRCRYFHRAEAISRYRQATCDAEMNVDGRGF